MFEIWKETTSRGEVLVANFTDAVTVEYAEHVCGMFGILMSHARAMRAYKYDKQLGLIEKIPNLMVVRERLTW